MHEFGLCEAIVETVERRAAGLRVAAVRVRVGARHRVVGPALEQAFSLAAEGTVAEGARVDLVVVPLLVTCGGCGHAAHADDPPVACTACGGVDVEVSGGDELTLESIEFGSVAARSGIAGDGQG